MCKKHIFGMSLLQVTIYLALAFLTRSLISLMLRVLQIPNLSLAKELRSKNVTAKCMETLSPPPSIQYLLGMYNITCVHRGGTKYFV